MFTNTERKNWIEESEAMTIICNIQAMQSRLYGDSFSYNSFNGNSLAELRELQDRLIPEYNESLKPIN